MGQDDGAPADPMTALAEGSTHLHELYSSYVAAGFAPQQALYLVGQVLRAAFSSAPSGD